MCVFVQVKKPLIHAEVVHMRTCALMAPLCQTRARLLQRPQKPLNSFDFPGTKLYIASGGRSIVSVVCLCFFFSLTLILLAVQLRDGRFCTAALDSRLPLPHRLIVFDRVDSVYSETHRSNSARANNIRKIHKFLNYPKQTATLRNAG